MSTKLFEDKKVTALRFDDDGVIPNNRLPLLIYPQAVVTNKADPEAMEALLQAGGWPPRWRATVFTYHHFHSTAHEVLGVAAGSARIMFGGPQGDNVQVMAGDVVVIPAGVGHKRLSSSDDFLVVGGYPPGSDWDLLTGEAGERPAADENIVRVELPQSDPVFGINGPLLEIWGGMGR